MNVVCIQVLLNINGKCNNLEPDLKIPMSLVSYGARKLSGRGRLSDLVCIIIKINSVLSESPNT